MLAYQRGPALQRGAALRGQGQVFRFLAIVTGLILAPAGLAADIEHRDFGIYVDGKRAGHYHMAITRNDDGSVAMAGHADVRVSYLVYRYAYNYRGTEVWKDGHLQRLDSACNDNGKGFNVNAATDGTAVHVNVNGREHACRSDVWTTTYWRPPDPKFHNQSIPLLDCDTGRPLSATLLFIGTTQLNVGGRVQNCTQYRLAGQVTADLWYDAQERLVREDTIEEGHRTVIELVQIRR
jgi:hypothetical protein